MRIESDYEMSPAWILVMIIPIILAIVFVVVLFGTIASIGATPTGAPPPAGLFATLLGLFLVFLVGIFIVQILFAYMLYKLIDRRNKHLLRQLFLYDDLTNLAKELATKKGVDISLNLNNMQRTSQEARFEETEKSAALWAIVTFFIWITAYYVYYFLMKDFYRHERREDMFVEDLNRALMASGLTVNVPRRTWPIPDRSFILYFILSIVTVGIFSIYWTYVLLTDPNSHFRTQALTEDTILQQVAPMMT